MDELIGNGTLPSDVEEMRAEQVAKISAMTDRELSEYIAIQNMEITRILAEGVGALQSFQTGPMGSMVARMFGGGK